MSVHWLLLAVSDVPEEDDWLSQRERSVAAGLRFAKRRTNWRLGRFTAKRALGAVAAIDALDQIEVIAAEDGAPEAFVDGKRSSLEISISHRDGIGACAVVPNGIVGCDLEAIEPRTGRFVNDFFTEAERRAVDHASESVRERLVALTWSAKESALKILRVGLHRDTRDVEVEVDDLGAVDSKWHPIRVAVHPEERNLEGWWRQEGEMVLTVLSDPPLPMTGPV